MGAIHVAQGPIGGDPIDKVLKAVQIAQTIYGIKNHSEEADALQQRTEQERAQAQRTADIYTQQNDPNSPLADITRAGFNAALGVAQKTELGKKNASALGDFAKAINETVPNAPVDVPPNADPNFVGPPAPPQGGPEQHKLTYTQMMASYAPLKDIFDKVAPREEVLPFMAASQSARGERNEISVNKSYSQEVGKYENQIQNANKVASIIGQIQNGDLKSTKSIKGDLGTAVAGMLAGGKPATVYGMSSQEVDSAYSRLQALKDFAAGTTSDTIPAAQLDQLKKDVMALRTEYLDNHDVAFQSFKEGLPQRLQGKLENRFNKFRSLSTQAGSNPSSGGIGFGTSASASDTPPNGAPGGHQSVIQNGHTYNWNPSTKQYE